PGALATGRGARTGRRARHGFQRAGCAPRRADRRARGRHRAVIRRPALVGAFAARLMLLPLGQRFIVTGDEARFANLAQDMLARGTWFDAQRYRNKPLLYPWAIKIFSMPGGRVTEATSQLPIVLPLPVVIIWLLTDAGVRGLRRLGSALGLLAFI